MRVGMSEFRESLPVHPTPSEALSLRAVEVDGSSAQLSRV
jgi:hypothetical protein